ncbi:hypothetical protein [Pallidibacillus thermolactis]|jgi:chromosome segregation ATPase|uniref:hypothetical protein n=1 Tax=Pallidibacillus thermolactis TaxID=251051 RepID=UPI002E24F3ED|nr:hypothetical protein [Pallidibacillus thermolactis subsp. kokeshiiformis]
MGLYFNIKKHPTVFQSQQRIPEKHQEVYRVDFLEKLLTEQKNINKNINKSIHSINQMVEQYGNKHSKQLQDINSSVQIVKNKQVEQASSDKNIKETLDLLLKEQSQSHEEVVTRLKHLFNNHNETDENIKKLFEKIESEQEYLRNVIQAYFTEIIEQQATHQKQLEQGNFNQEEIRINMKDLAALGNVFKEQLQLIEKAQQELLEMLQSLDKNQKHLTSKMEEQGDYQSGILNRLETQEAYTDKILRQLDHLRSVIFERAGVIVEKIEKGFKQTTSHITRFFNTSERQSLDEFIQDVEVKKEKQEKIKS